MRTDRDAVLECVNEIYDCAFDPAGWSDLLPRITRLVGGTRSAIGEAHLTNGLATVLRVHEVDPLVSERFAKDFGCQDPCFTVTGPAPPGSLLDQSIYARHSDQLRRVDVYRGLFIPAGLSNCNVAVLATRQDTVTFLGVYRSVNEGAFSPDQVETARLLAPHLARAAALQTRLAGLEETRHAWDHFLALLPFGVVALDARGRLLFANAQAERLFRCTPALCLRNGTLSALRQPEGRQLAMAIAGAIATAEMREAPGPSAIAVRRDNQSPLQLLISPVPRQSVERYFDLKPQPAALVMVMDPDQRSILSAHALSRTFGLTPRLSELAAALAAGKTVTEYADEAGVTVGTARQQLKELFARTGTRRQAELVRLLLISVAAFRPRREQ